MIKENVTKRELKEFLDRFEAKLLEKVRKIIREELQKKI